MKISFQARERRPREAEVNAGARIPQEEKTSGEARISLRMATSPGKTPDPGQGLKPESRVLPGKILKFRFEIDRGEKSGIQVQFI
jgi:hypothetical protein